MKLVLLLLYTISFTGILSESVDVNKKCQCENIQTIEECNINCEWNIKEEKCKNETLPLIRTSYCSYLSDKCNKTLGCANYNGICVPFTGCTAIKYNTNYECKQYSELCITDGQKCVERSVCQDYKTRLSCRNNYINYEWSGFCYWDKIKCRNAENCHELSFTLKNDAECRQQFSWCTFKIGGGCEDSGEQCKDQKFEQQCITNRKGNIKCYWDKIGFACYDQSCKYIKNDCIKNGCSIDQDQQCIDRLECNEYHIEKSCTYNKQNIQCIWEDNECRIKQCENASTSRKTNEQCQKIDSNCITKFGGGCKKNGECEDANSQQGCQQNIKGDFCIWNGYQCVIKQCQWAKTENSCLQSNCVYKDEKCLEDGCSAQLEKSNCNGKCQWLNQCDIKTCETAGRNIQYTTHKDCYNYESNCTLNDSGIGCMLMKYSCNQYNRQIQCYQSIQSKCLWHDNQCIESKCEYLNYYTHDECNYHLNNCTTDGLKCIELKLQCSQYTHVQSCNLNSEKHYCIWQNNKCIDMTCDLIPKSYNYNTHQDCYTYSSKCTIIDRIIGCIKMPSDCNLLTQDQCYGNKCIYSNGMCREKQCKDYQGDITQSNCEVFIEGKKCMRGPSLYPNSCVDQVQECDEIKNEYQCNEVKDIHNNKCRWEFSACIQWNQKLLKKDNQGNCPNGSTSFDQNFCSKQKQCNDPQIHREDYTNQICENYLISCMMDTKVSCKDKNEGNSSQCIYYKSKEYCNQQSHCYWSNIAVDTCSELKNSCSELTKQEDCKDNRDSSGTFCIWDNNNFQCLNICQSLTPKNLSCSIQDSKCVLKGDDNKKCTKKLSNCSDYKVSEEECKDDNRCTYTYYNQCIEKQCSDLTDSETHDECYSYKSECTIAYPGGCSDLLPNCQDYKSEIQCQINDKSKACYWSEYKGCIEQKCSEISYDPEKGVNKCLTFFTHIICNINEKGDACEDLKDSCTKYNNDNQCRKQLDGYECMWKDQKCQQAICQDIKYDDNIYSHEICYNKYNKIKCTVNLTNDGCTDLFSDCKLYQTIEQCIITHLKEDCVWNQLYQQCNFKSCKDSLPENMKCSEYLSSCIEPQQFCRNIICEDYQHNNDDECRKQDNKCTSNGRFCIERRTCEENQYQQACNKDINNRLCSWNSAKQQCNYVQCQDAPSTFVQTQTCEEYFPNQNCVTKYGGGCLITTGCFDYTIQGQCDESKLFDCIWENNTCRAKICQDYKLSYILECQTKNCTTDGITCVEMKDCASLSQSTCLIGTDGICMYLNDRCQPFKNCQSIQFNSHQQCYDTLQNQCTSNGTHCIPLTTCNEYSDQISCVKGIDGHCAWENSKCSIFTSCENYKYKIHEECNSIHSSCTTDTIDKCIKLLECSKYVENNCKLDKNGVIKKNGLITQLDKCIWKNQQCINIKCVDLYGTEHKNCYQQLSNCTSDGVKCIEMEKSCSSYQSNICDTTYSQEGKCSNVNSICSLIDCSTKTVEIQCKGLQHCQFINNSCQSYSKCQEYKTEKDCTIGTDGQCVFNNSQCKLMIDCADANKIQLCSTKSCFWNDTSSQCINHTCKTYAVQNSCGLFYNYQKTQITYCAFYDKDRLCKDINPTSFIPNCYQKSLGYFSTYNGTCQFCNQSIPTNQSNQTNTTDSTYASILYGVFTLIIGLVIII